MLQICYKYFKQFLILHMRINPDKHSVGVSCHGISANKSRRVFCGNFPKYCSRVFSLNFEKNSWRVPRTWKSPQVMMASFSHIQYCTWNMDNISVEDRNVLPEYSYWTSRKKKYLRICQMHLIWTILNRLILLTVRSTENALTVFLVLLLLIFQADLTLNPLPTSSPIKTCFSLKIPLTMYIFRSHAVIINSRVSNSCFSDSVYRFHGINVNIQSSDICYLPLLLCLDTYAFYSILVRFWEPHFSNPLPGVPLLDCPPNLVCLFADVPGSVF